MNLDSTELIKLILEKTNKKSLPIEDAIKIFIDSRIQNVDTAMYYKNKLGNVYKNLISMNITETSQITNETIHILAATLIKRVKPQTVNKYIQSLLTMLKYLSEERDLISIPTFKWKKLKENNYERKVLTSSEIEHIYKILSNKSLRIQVVFRLLFETGVRRTEATRIKISNINFENNSIFLENFDTKAKRSRYIFITDDFKKIIQQYIKEYNSKFFLLENDGYPMSSSSISSIVERLKKDSNINYLSPHILRRSFATIMLLNGANILSVKTLLGHASLTQTNKYLISNFEQLQKDFIEFNPVVNILK